VATGINHATNRSDDAFGEHLHAPSDDVPIRDAFSSQSVDVDIEHQKVFKECWSFEIARTVNPWPRHRKVRWAVWAGAIPVRLGEDTPAALTEQSMLSLFHVQEKRRKVGNAGCVGFSKLDASIPGKNRRITRRHKA